MARARWLAKLAISVSLGLIEKPCHKEYSRSMMEGDSPTLSSGIYIYVHAFTQGHSHTYKTCKHMKHTHTQWTNKNMCTNIHSELYCQFFNTQISSSLSCLLSPEWLECITRNWFKEIAWFSLYIIVYPTIIHCLGIKIQKDSLKPFLAVIYHWKHQCLGKTCHFMARGD